MKKIIGILIGISLISSVQAQHGLYNSQWLSGPGTLSGMNQLIIREDTVIIDTVFNTTTMKHNAVSVCDSLGNLLFYSNGLRIMNKDNQIMENGDSLMFNYFWAYYNQQYGDNPTVRSALILPFPDHPNQYVMTYETIEDFSGPFTGLRRPLGLYYCIIDMNANGGLGRVLEKDIRVLEDTLGVGIIQAVKHGNGKDWWIVAPEYATNCSYMLLLDESGMSLKRKQCIGDTMRIEWSGLCQSVFSPDGRRYAKINYLEQAFLYDYDRCLGLFTSFERLEVTDDVINKPGISVAFSSNSRYLYTANGVEIFQFDMEASDIGASAYKIAHIDSFMVGNQILWFAFQCLAPNKKIYIVAGTYGYMHTIENPDTAGQYVSVTQHSILLPRPLNGAIPNFANYNLGSLPDPCPTVSIEESLGASIKVYPNPAGLVVKVEIKDRGVFGLIDLQGREILSRVLTEEKTDVPVGSLGEGVYIYRIKTDKGDYYGKLVIQR